MTNTSTAERSRTKQLEVLTDAQHQQLHRLVAEGNPFATRENFAIWVSVQYQFQQKIADLYRNPTLKSLLPDLEDRSRLQAAAADLKDLGQEVPQADVMNADDLTTAQVLGWLFVSEGSTLGAAVLRKKASESLGLSDEFGARHLAASPEGRARHWKAFTALVNELPMSEEEERQLGEAAQAAFTYFAVELRNAYGIPA
ncbi:MULTISPECIES: biliverdin-producing heme oxygenase [unclassified Oceanobacter]|uniref:biliverdin-producing heme oxygenase n=1 Tax=unclassified Oceanobacter TaxID=2620260 RepID=UPI0026E42AA6|nr:MULTISPECIES: biliverdin-producing heme oxygenase [unclassified Oceanobacter]MDO6682458.1 biliverdin-producing heme oxygenase [Oceanobacter sp. 5_MG-2023]MDP2548789.1 biliverdin-producing heme oxygenase [Oceanobacter sp. 4_MG-2023]